jgi:flagellar basal body-associated protein FliL
MKRKEMIQLVVAVIILVVAGSLIYAQLAPASKTTASSAPTIPKITPVATGFNQSALSNLTDTSKTRDFYQAPNLASGLGNSQPFGPLQ